MARRGQRLGLFAAAAGTIGAAVVALVLVIGLQQEVARVSDALASRTAELGDLRAQVVSLEDQLGDQRPAAATSTRLTTLEAQLAALEAQLGDTMPAAATTTRLTSLEDRVVALENATTAPAGAVHPVITARHFQLVDDQGQELAVLGVDQVGFPELRLVRERESLSLGFDADGPQVVLSNLGDRPRIRLGFAEGNRPSISVHDASAAPRVEMVDTDEIVGLRLRDATGRERAALVSTPDASVLRLNSATQIRAALVGGPDGSTLVLNDAQESPRALLSFSEENGPDLTFLDEHGGRRAAIIVKDTLGVLGFFDDHDIMRTSLAFSGTGGVLSFSDSQGSVRTVLGFADEAGSALGLYDAQGTPRALLSRGASPEGVGLTLHDAQGALAGIFIASETGSQLRLVGRDGTASVALGTNDGAAGLTISDAQDAMRVHLGFRNEGLALRLLDENRTSRAIMGFDPATLEPLFLTRDAEGNETWRSGPAAGA